MPIAPLLQRFVDDELARAETLIERSLGETQALLRDFSDPGTGPAERALQVELVERLKRLTGIYKSTFVESLRSRVGAELSRDEDGHGQGMGPPSGLAGLTLMNESRVEIDIEISRATQLLDAAAEWELRELQTFTSTLIGQTHVSAESNPLRPMFYATALWDAACAVHPAQAQRAALLRVSSMACAPLLKKAWAAASTRLESQGVAPGAYRSLVTPSSSLGLPMSPGGSRAESALRMSHLLAVIDRGESEVRLSAGMVAGRPGAGAVPPPAPFSPEFEAELVQYDTTLRRIPATALSNTDIAALATQLEAHRKALSRHAGTAVQRPVIALLGRLFDAMLVDPDLQPGFVMPVARLQVPALRVALRDASTLDTAQHPVWLLLDRIGQASATYPQPTDPRGAAVATLCSRLAEELARHPHIDAEFFRKGLAKLEQFLTAQLQAQLKAAELPLQALREAETLLALELQLEQRLVEQMAPLRPSSTVRRFMSSTWSRVLATAILRHGEDAEPARGYIKLVDDLLWSVQTPDHPASRQRLAAMLPTLLQGLRAGMASIALPEAEQAAFLDELLTLHTAALRRGEEEGAGTAAVHVPRPPRGGAAVDTTTPHASLMIDLASLETVPAALLPAQPDTAAADGPPRQIAALRPAERRRMFVNGRWARVQLLWHSDSGEFFLFAGESAGQTHSITRRALERLAAAGLLRPLEDKPLTQRALGSVERKLALAAGAAG